MIGYLNIVNTQGLDLTVNAVYTSGDPGTIDVEQITGKPVQRPD